MIGVSIGLPAGKKPGLGSKLIGSLFLSVFLVVGLVFAWLMARQGWRDLQTYSWQAISCEIVSSSVEESDSRDEARFTFKVNYRYASDGKDHTATAWKTGGNQVSDRAEAGRLVQQFPVGLKTVCFVPPGNPTGAVLQRSAPWMLLLLFFPGIFVVIGGGGIWLLWFGRETPATPGATRLISDRPKTGGGTGFLLVFFSFFIFLGGLGSWFLLVEPVAGIIRARFWQSTPCVIEHSSVRSHRGNKGSTYTVDIVYRFDMNGREYRGYRATFIGGSSSGYDGKAKLVARFPAGSRAFCFVNPGDPNESVLDRNFHPVMFFGLIPLLFLTVGISGFVWNWRRRNRPTQAVIAEDAPPVMRHRGGAGGEHALKPSTSPWVVFFVALGVCLFWNGVVSIFVGQAVISWMRGRPEWVLSLFMIPFVVIGLGMLGFVVYSFMALFNPRPHLTIQPEVVPLDGSMQVRWQLTGRTGVVRRLQIHLEGREEAQYRRGTSTVTDRRIFFRRLLVESENPVAIESGERSLTLPAGLMHSFAGTNNRIVWGLQVHGEIRWWPDVQLEFPVIIGPAINPGKVPT